MYSNYLILKIKHLKIILLKIFDEMIIYFLIIIKIQFWSYRVFNTSKLHPNIKCSCLLKQSFSRDY